MKGNRLFSRRFGYMLIFPSAIVFLIVSIYPLLTGIMLSFQNSSLYKGDEKKFVGLKNIITILTSDAEFRSDLLFTVIYTIGIVVIAYITGYKSVLDGKCILMTVIWLLLLRWRIYSVQR